MAYHYISRPNLLDSSITVYYAGDNKWTDNFDDRHRFSTKAAATAHIQNPDGKNGGWSRCSIVQG